MGGNLPCENLYRCTVCTASTMSAILPNFALPSPRLSAPKRANVPQETILHACAKCAAYSIVAGRRPAASTCPETPLGRPHIENNVSWNSRSNLLVGDVRDTLEFQM